MATVMQKIKDIEDEVSFLTLFLPIFFGIFSCILMFCDGKCLSTASVCRRVCFFFCFIAVICVSNAWFTLFCVGPNEVSIHDVDN